MNFYTLRNRLGTQYRDYATNMAALRSIEIVAEDLGIIDLDFYIDFGISDYKTLDGEFKDLGPYLKLEPAHVPGVGFGMNKDGPTMELTDTTPTLGEAARLLLSKIGQLDKSYDEDTNKIRLTGTYKGVRIILEDTPPSTCTVEKIEEEVEVPEKVIAAHTEKQVRYKLVGDCEPLMKKEKISLDKESPTVI